MSEIDKACRTAEIGCVACKRELAANVNQYLSDFRERYAEVAAHPEKVREMLGDAAQTASRMASEVLAEAKRAIGIAN